MFTPKGQNVDSSPQAVTKPPSKVLSMTNSALTLKSNNDKTGAIPVSTTSRISCPPTCPLAGDGGCYAEAGYYTRMHWDAVTAGTRGLPVLEFIAAVAKLKPGSKFRHNVAGDLWHEGGAISADLLRKLADATTHLKAAWTYTHHLRTRGNLAAIRSAIRRGFTVNLSTEVRSEAARFAKRGLPVVCVVPEGSPAKFEHDGVTFRQCPATFDGSPTQCASCGGGVPLCARANRSFVVTFPVHGGRAKVATTACG
jgi:hypothetical protein